mgnify:CR=1
GRGNTMILGNLPTEPIYVSGTSSSGVFSPKDLRKCKPTHPYKTGDFISAEVPKGIHAGVYSPRRIVSLTDETRVR